MSGNPVSHVDRVEQVPTLWDDRYGVGSFQRMLALLERPCISFARIASEFGVSRERVRQWQLQYRPGSPTGQERRRLCQELKARRKMFADEVFAAFYQRARAQLRRAQFGLLESASGFRTRAIRLDRHVVGLCDGRGVDGASAGRSRDVWMLNAPDAAFFFVLLDAGHFVFVHREAASSVFRSLAADEAGDRVLATYRDTFNALAVVDQEPVTTSES